ncbi:hypothetical protein [Pedobacter frigiditerrae]|uniref:hypothetical protein n=1 Tax=Pedobacter frigiditerrae TaxID=2530452 RepID=UPI00292E6F0D|nr:hypothetical protein [Pedobacter frigiditerrae]
MKYNLKTKSCFTLLLLMLAVSAVAQTSSKLKEIHQQFYGKWPKTITFVQKTSMLRADTVFRTQTWYEAGIFPNLFRIDLGDIKDGNAIIYRGDSTYNIRKFKKVQAVIDPNILVYLLGGMYFETLEQVNKKLTDQGFDLTKAHKSKWKGRAIDIIGTSVADTTVSQLWYDSKNHYLVRMIQQRPKSRLECQFENHQQIGKMWHEGNVKIYVQNKLVQTEKYSDFKINVELNPDFFNPDKFGSWHWMKK